MDDAPNNPETPDRAWVAREANAVVRRLAEMFHDARAIGFFCECGCMGLAVMTAAQYDEQGGAWCENHKPTQP
jgi:hypothetical protein